VGDLADVVRLASKRPLKDAAFFIAFNIRNGRINENALDVLKSSHMSASDSEINEAISESNRLEAYCLAMAQDHWTSAAVHAFPFRKRRMTTPDLCLKPTF
jgi:hypothetical protein